MHQSFTEYERAVRDEIEGWKQEPPGRVAKALNVLDKPLRKPVAWVMEKTVVGHVLEGMLQVVMDGASWTIDERRILDRYRAAGFELTRLEDIRTRVPLETMDEHAAAVGKGYRAAMFVEGGAAGAGGLAGPVTGAAILAADLVALTGAACRCTAHHAAIYGFRLDEPRERALAMKVLVGATSADMAAKESALVELRAIAMMVAKRKTWDELEKSVLVKSIEEAADRLSIRLTKAKLGQVVAVIGVMVGAGYNSWYLTRVSEWSFYTFRERHLDARSEARVRAAPSSAADSSGPDVEMIEAQLVDSEVQEEDSLSQ